MLTFAGTHREKVPTQPHRYASLHTHTWICTHSCPEMYPQCYTDTNTPTHAHTCTHPQTHGHVPTRVKTHPGRGRPPLSHGQLGGGSGAMLRRRGLDPIMPHSGSWPGAQGQDAGGMSSAPREQGDQQLPNPHPSSTDSSSFTDPGSGALDSDSSGGGQGSRPTRTLPTRATLMPSTKETEAPLHSQVQCQTWDTNCERDFSVPFRVMPHPRRGPGHHCPGSSEMRWGRG